MAGQHLTIADLASRLAPQRKKAEMASPKGDPLKEDTFEYGGSTYQRGPKGPKPITPEQPSPDNKPKSFRRGGKVKKTGVYELHKGEKVLTRRQALYGKG